jgi:hypothetical protein
VGLTDLRASLGCGGSLGPVHRDREAMRWSCDGEPRRKIEQPDDGHLPEVEIGQQGADKRHGAFLM